MEPGIYEDLSNEAYHSSAGISKSGLDKIAQSPALFKHVYIDGNKPEPTPAMIVGAATHTAVFEPDIYDDQYAVAPKVDRRTKAGKEAFAEFEESSKGKVVLKAEDHEQIIAISEAVRHHPLAAAILANGAAETSIYQNEMATGELVKVRPDWIAGDLLVDLKTSESAHPDAFSVHAYRWRYDVQAALYLDIANQALNGQFANFLFIVAEKKEPFQVAFYFADFEMIHVGRLRYQEDLLRYSELKKSGLWPGYNDDKIVPLSLPRWATRRIESNSEFGPF